MMALGSVSVECEVGVVGAYVCVRMRRLGLWHLGHRRSTMYPSC